MHTPNALFRPIRSRRVHRLRRLAAVATTATATATARYLLKVVHGVRLAAVYGPGGLCGHECVNVEHRIWFGVLIAACKTYSTQKSRVQKRFTCARQYPNAIIANITRLLSSCSRSIPSASNLDTVEEVEEEPSVAGAVTIPKRKVNPAELQEETAVAAMVASVR